MNKSKALKTAKEWLNPALMFAIFDCCDSMETAEALENRFNAYVDDSIEISEFVKQNLRKEYIKECIEVAQFEGCKREDVIDELKDTPSTLPIPWEEIQKEVEEALNKPF